MATKGTLLRMLCRAVNGPMQVALMLKLLLKRHAQLSRIVRIRVLLDKAPPQGPCSSLFAPFFIHPRGHFTPVGCCDSFIQKGITMEIEIASSPSRTCDVFHSQITVPSPSRRQEACTLLQNAARTRLFELGPKALSDVELLSLVLRAS